jgi:uroporphyrinogen-III synthase
MSKPSGVRLVSLESRRASDLAGLLDRAGFEVLTAPSMQEVPLTDQRDALAFAGRMVSPDYELLVLMTGVGLRMLLDVAQTRFSREQILAGLASRPIACRGPKPVAVLKEFSLRPQVVAPEPNTYRELLSALDAWEPLRDKRVVVQEYGQANLDFDAGLVTRGAQVDKVPIYAWALPDDLSPLQEAVRRLCEGEADGLVLTSQQQLHHLLAVAEGEQRKEALIEALRSRVLVASIGPITSEALRVQGITPDVEPVHGKMGHLAKALREQALDALAKKRAR